MSDEQKPNLTELRRRHEANPLEARVLYGKYPLLYQNDDTRPAIKIVDRRRKQPKEDNK